MKFRLISILMLLTTVATVKGQHVPLQSQYMFNGVALNPALTGSEEAFSIVGSFRAQWVGIEGAPMTQSVTAHAPLKKMNSSVGVQIYADQIGVDRNTGVFLSYAYQLRFERSKLSLGMAGGVNFLRSYFSRLQVNDPNDNQLMLDSPLGIMPDFSLGAHYFTDRYFVSFSVPMFLTHDYDGSKFIMSNDFNNYNVMLGGGAVFDLQSGTRLKPSLLAKYHAGANMQFDINMMVLLNEAIDVGLSYRTQEAIVGLIEYRASDQLGVMYSFGFPLNPLGQYTYGSHEVSVKYNFLYKTGIQGPRFLGW